MDRLDPAISVIVSGHTHQAYACRIKRGGTDRLLTSAGRYGNLVTDIRLEFDRSTRALTARSAHNVPVRPELGQDARINALVQRYAAAAAPAAARVVGKLSRSRVPKSETDEEGTAGDLIADAQLAATWRTDRGAADISFINAPGIRTSLIPQADGTVTYGQIFAVQPFGNNLVVKPLTGAQLKAALEQQFTLEEAGRGQLGSLLIPSGQLPLHLRHVCFLKGQRINGDDPGHASPMMPRGSYRVTVNNFLSIGGDGFSVFADVSRSVRCRPRSRCARSLSRADAVGRARSCDEGDCWLALSEIRAPRWCPGEDSVFAT